MTETTSAEDAFTLLSMKEVDRTALNGMLDYEAPETAEENDAPAAAAAVGGAAAAAPPQLEVAAAAVGDVYCGHRDASLLKWMRTEIPHVLVVYVPANLTEKSQPIDRF